MGRRMTCEWRTLKDATVSWCRCRVLLARAFFPGTPIIDVGLPRLFRDSSVVPWNDRQMK